MRGRFVRKRLLDRSGHRQAAHPPREQDNLLWATDEGWWSFGAEDRQMNQHCTFFEELGLPDEVHRKIYRGNAVKVHGLNNP